MREYVIGGALAFVLNLAFFLLGVQVGCIWGANEMKYQLTPRPTFNDEDKSEMRSILEPVTEGGSHE